MKKLFTAIYAVLAIAYANAQSIEVLDQNTLQPIIDVEVSSAENPTNIVKTNEKGLVDISPFTNTPKLIFKNINYVSASFTLDQLKEENYKIYMEELKNTLEEVVISANKFNEKRKDVVQKIQVIRTSDLQNMNQSSTADVMTNTGNILVQKSQQGGGSPVIRGFETNKVLMVIDGIRMNNAIYRGGHIQNIITLDNAVMEKVEVTFGPGSVVYGSDALGGVMSFYTRNPVLAKDSSKIRVKANGYLRETTANSGYSRHADVSVGGRRFGSLTSLTLSNFGDLRQGAQRNPEYGNLGARPWYVKQVNGVDSLIANADSNLQIGSSYTQYDLLQKFLFQQDSTTCHIINVQFSNSGNVNRYDRLTQTKDGMPRFGSWYYGPQKRLLTSYTLNLSKVKKFYDHARIIAAYQQIEESRIDRRYKKNIENHRIENLNIYSFNMDFDKKIKRNEFRYGLDAYYNDVQSNAFTKDLLMDTLGVLDTRYPDGGSSMKSIAAYLTHTWEISEKLIFNEGIRYTRVNLQSKFINKDFFPFPYNSVNQDNNAVNGNLGVIYMPTTSFRFNAGVSSGYRAPNVDDLSKVFESQKGSIIVPNPNLKPEYTYTSEIGISQSIDKRILVGANAYHTNYINAISVQNGKFDGKDSIMYQGELSQVQTTSNSAKAYIYGFEGSLSGNLNKNLTVFATINYTYGRIAIDSTDIPLDHIPPVFGKINFNLHVKKFTADFFIYYNGWKKIADYSQSGEDNQSNGNALATGMPSWYTTNLRLTYRFNKFASLQVACENIFDQNYRQFASNISAAGRNFICTLRGNF